MSDATLNPRNISKMMILMGIAEFCFRESSWPPSSA
jgi:hypothetical protein